MSKQITTTAKETLHTCKQCGQTGFTASGLRTHQKSKTCKERAKEGQLTTTTGAPALMKEFDQARRYVSDIRELGRKAQHLSLLLGFELNKQKAALAVRKGPNKPHGAVYSGTWEALVTEQTGLSMDTCERWMTIARGASKHLTILTAKDVLEKPFSALPEPRQNEIIKVLHKAVDGQTMHQMMLTFGAWKDKAHKAPPKGTTQSAATRAANAANQTLTAEQLMKQAKDDCDAVRDMHIGKAWKTLDDAGLADLENILHSYIAEVSAEHKARKGTK